MNGKVKKALLIIGGIAVLLLLAHLTVNNLIPFVKEMHSGGAY